MVISFGGVVWALGAGSTWYWTRRMRLLGVLVFCLVGATGCITVVEDVSDVAPTMIEYRLRRPRAAADVEVTRDDAAARPDLVLVGVLTAPAAMGGCSERALELFRGKGAKLGIDVVAKVIEKDGACTGYAYRSTRVD